MKLMPPSFEAVRLTVALILILSINISCSSSPGVQKLSPQAVDRQSLVSRHNPKVGSIDPRSPFTLGNGHFAFTADVTGLQSFADLYFNQGIPLETKARWAWHERANPMGYSLDDTNETFDAYGRKVSFPTDMDSAAGQWLRQNPHDLPLSRIGFTLDQRDINPSTLSAIDQTLDLWRGLLTSRYTLAHHQVQVQTLVDSNSDLIAVQVDSSLLAEARLEVALSFPRGYQLNRKNTPDLDWSDPDAHITRITEQGRHYATLYRKIDNAQHWVALRWQGNAQLVKNSTHHYALQAGSGETQLNFTVEYLPSPPTATPLKPFADTRHNAAQAWRNFWMSGAAADFSGSRNSYARELERRIVLSRYIMATQSRATMPSQETGLTSSSWYGKHHTEMTYWHSAHWILWGNPEIAQQTLDWFVDHLPKAQQLAASRGLDGARWAKMAGPENRESPGGNPLIIWNQPQFIHLAELLYQRTNDTTLLHKYAELVDQSAAAMASMLVWDEAGKRYNLSAPIWIAQEIYDPRITRNPTFELAYWRTSLQIAQQWRVRSGKAISPDWQHKLDKLAKLPTKDGKYVAIESVPDTFDNITSRQDHPSMLAAYGMLKDETVDLVTMDNTLKAVITTWDWQQKIWGWDYPMIAMTATRLQQPELALKTLMANLVHNHYENNGHVMQQGAALPVYLPANGAFLSAVAMMLGGWQGGPERAFPGFPADGTWVIKAEGFKPY